MSERRVACGVSLIVRNDQGQVLLGKRKGSHGAGTYSFIGGWMEHGESFLDTAKREAMEEAGIEVHNIIVATCTNTIFYEEDKQSVTVFLIVDPESWSGTPKAMEPNKLDGEWGWYYPPAMPSPLFKPLADLGDDLLAFC